jgi:hypothetical protein
VSINRTALKNYAPKARQGFIAAAAARAAKFGISETDTVPMQEQGDVVIIDGEAFPKKIGAQRKALLGRIKLHGFGQTMEEVAYTWFNRFLAIRYMEVHGYLDHGYRVLSNIDGSGIPEILQHAEHVDLAALDKAKVIDLKLDENKDAEIYRLLLIAQCNALHESMPFLFEKIDDETELLLPDNLLHSDSLIRQLVNEIDEADWQEIEIIGWLYQFYISEKKDQVIGKVVKSEDIPAATQLFTPNWIVKYMVQNSLGHQWMATYPESSLKNQMEYYIEPAEQTPEVQAQLAEITPKELNPEELTLLDPAAGSGHILVEAYGLFKEIYLERGYRLKDIPRLILEKNLYGLDIDDRAAQMAGFALLMKARADDRCILSSPVHLNVMAIQSSEGMDAAETARHLMPSGRYELVASDDLLPDTLAQPNLAMDVPGEVEAGTIGGLINLFKDAKTFGSLIKVPEDIRKALPALGQLLEQTTSELPMERGIREHLASELRPLIHQANMLGRLYDCVVANPPYMGGKGFYEGLKEYCGLHYKEGKQNLYGAFLVRSILQTKLAGIVSMVAMENWMFISRYLPLRELIKREVSPQNLIHLGAGAFPEIGGEVVKTAAFSFRKAKIEDYLCSYIDLTTGESEVKRNQFASGNGTLFLKTLSDYFKIPGSPFAYWMSKAMLSCFAGITVGEKGDPREGMATGENDRFLRLWHEVAYKNIGIGLGSRTDASKTKRRWFPYNKGGEYRKWYGNLDYVVDWKDDGHVLQTRRHPSGRIWAHNFNLEYIFKSHISWSDITSNGLTVRYFPEGFLFDATGLSCFFEDEYWMFVSICAANTKMGDEFAKILNPTLHFKSGDFERFPLPKNIGSDVIQFVFQNAVKLAKFDWNQYETSWDFLSFPQLSSDLRKISTDASFASWQSQCTANIKSMKELEEENNRLFIEAYGLQDELAPEVSEDQITLARADKEQDIKRLISYSIGCMMGRYSLTEEGLIYANGGNEGFDPSRYGNFPVDDDGIVPITDTEWFDDDATVRFEEFLKVAWSPETLKENLKFIGDSLADSGGNDPVKTIRNYLSKGFYKDHLKTYKKRPIYWLFSSGKQRAFECLVYLHRYNEGTLARMRMEYVTPLQGRMSARIDQLGGDVNAASSTAERNRKQKEKDKLVKQMEELRTFDEELRHYADQRITLDLDDGVKVNYGKFGKLLSDVKAITGKK